MKTNRVNRQRDGFTLVEISIGLAVLVIVGGIAYSTLMGSTTLFAKNLSLNSSNTAVRRSIDRLYAAINQANGLPKLIDATGNPVAMNADGTGGPAAGFLFDRYVGGPFIVGNPGTGLPASTTTVRLFYSTNSLASPPAPVKNDVAVIDGATRALVKSCTVPSSYSSPMPSPTPVAGKMLTVTLENSLGSYMNPPVTSGTAISWGAQVQQIAYVLHRKAFVVVPTNGRAELRMYSDAEKITDYSDPTKYTVLSREIGTQTVNGLAENKPFSLVAQNGTIFLNVAMRVEDQQFNNYLATRQAKDFSTFLRVDTTMRPRNFLQ